jgi:hypothetical protein
MDSANRMAAAPRRSSQKSAAFTIRPERIVADHARVVARDLSPARQVGVLWNVFIASLTPFPTPELWKQCSELVPPLCKGGGPTQSYNAVATAPNFVERFVPISVTAVMMTTAINEAIKPYSMAVTPDWSLAKRRRRVFIGSILCLSHRLIMKIRGRQRFERDQADAAPMTFSIWRRNRDRTIQPDNL